MFTPSCYLVSKLCKLTISAGVCIVVVNKCRLMVFLICWSVLAWNRTFYKYGDVAYVCVFVVMRKIYQLPHLQSLA